MSTRSRVLAPLPLHPKWHWPRGSLILGDTNGGRKVWVRREDRAVHTFISGASGSGKSMLLAGLIRQNILAMNGERRCTIVIDPHGTLVENTLRWIATHRLHEHRAIRLIDPSDPEHVFGINPVRSREGVDPAVIASAVLNAILTAGWSDEDATAMPMLREVGKATLYVLAALGLTFLEIDDLFDFEDRAGLRQYVIENIRHPSVRRTFENINSLSPAKVIEIVGSFLRRMNECLLPAAMRRMFAARDRIIDFAAEMEAGSVVLVNLAHGNGRISEDESTLLGCLIVTDIFLSSLGRPEGATAVDLIADEAHRFLTSDVANILDQSRKFSLAATLATQHLGHLRDRGEHIFRSVMANTRTKIVFGGLDDDDATLMARNMFRGSFDLQRAKHRYDKPTVVGQEYDWLRSEGTSRGTAKAHGTNWTHGYSHADSHSMTESRSVTLSRGVTNSTSDTVGESETVSTARSRSRSQTRSQSDTDSFGATNSWGTSQAHGGNASTSEATLHSYAEQYGTDETVFGGYRLEMYPGAATISAGGSQTSGSGTSWNSGSSQGGAETRSSSRSSGTADSIGIADTTGRATSKSYAHSTGTAISEGIAITDGFAETFGTTDTENWSEGGSTTHTDSQTETTGRAQTLRSRFETMVTTPFSLEELVHLASVSIANLSVGEAIVKLGKRRPVRIKTLRIKEGWATEGHVAGVKRRLAEAAPFITPLAEARAAYVSWRKELLTRVTHQQLPAPSEAVLDLTDRALEPAATPLKPVEDEWG